MNKINAQIFKDNNDVIIVLKNCEKSIEDFVKSLLDVSAVTDIPSLAPVESPEIQPPVIPEESKVEPEVKEEPSSVVDSELPIVESPVIEELPVVESPLVEEAPTTETPQPADTPSVVCPMCGEFVELTEAGVACNCGFKLNRVVKDRRSSDEELKTLLAGKKTDYLSGFIGQGGKPYSAKMFLNKNKKVQFDFNKG